MKTIFKKCIVSLFLVASVIDCFGLTEIREVTAEQAGELGVVIKSKKYADDRIWISLELRTKGEFERFRRVDLAVKLGGVQLVTAPLEVTRSKPETISVGFFAHPSSLADSELQVVVDSRGSIVSQFKLRNFVNTKENSSKKAQKESTKAVHDQPAASGN